MTAEQLLSAGLLIGYRVDIVSMGIVFELAMWFWPLLLKSVIRPIYPIKTAIYSKSSKNLALEQYAYTRRLNRSRIG